MIVPIFIDTSNMLYQFDNINKAQVENLCNNVAKTLGILYVARLVEEADKALHQTKKIYKDAIQVSDTGKFESTVMLNYSNPLVKMIEEGCAPFDMKIKMLESVKVKTTKKGTKYLTIPMRMGVPTTIGESDVFSTIMPQSIYDVVKNKKTNIAARGGGTRSKGLSFGELPVQNRAKNIRAAIIDSDGKTLFEKYESVSPIFQGIIKNIDNTTNQAKYNTFRRVSSNSNKLAFIHKGFERYNLIGKALNNFDTQGIVTIQIKTELSKLGIDL